MFWDSEGSASVEIAILLPFIMFFLIFILSLIIYVFQSSVLTIYENRSIQKHANHVEIERKYPERDIFIRRIARVDQKIDVRFYFNRVVSYFYPIYKNEVRIKKELPMDHKIKFLNTVDFIVDHYNIYLKGAWKNEK